MKRFFVGILILLLLFSSCGKNKTPDAGRIGAIVKENRDDFQTCAEEMKQLGRERVFVAIEEIDGNEFLVLYEKESDDRDFLENEILEEALRRFGFAVIFFQTGSDSEQSVIFSYQKESDQAGIGTGFYYSFSGKPRAYWGRSDHLAEKGGMYIQTDRQGEAWYYTTHIEENFYYFEKHGKLTA